MSSARVITSTSGFRAPVRRRNRQQQAASSAVLAGRNRQQQAASSAVLTGRNLQQQAASSAVLTGRNLQQQAGSSAVLTGRNLQQQAASSAVLAGRNQAVVAVGAWVECGQEFMEHPEDLALLTEEIQAEKRRENEESLRRFQDEVRHRVAQQAHVSRRRRQPQTDLMVKPDRRIPPQQRHVWTQHVSAGGAVQQRSSQKSSEGMKQVRLRLAACRMMPCEEGTSDLPGGEWNVSPTRHKDRSHVLRAEQQVEEEEEEDVEGEEEEEEEEGDDHLFTTQHECPLIQQKISGHVSLDSDRSQPVPGFQSSPPRVLWPQTNQEELKRQRLSQFLMHRRLYMNIEREQVKENQQHRKHLKKTASDHTHTNILSLSLSSPKYQSGERTDSSGGREKVGERSAARRGQTEAGGERAADSGATEAGGAGESRGAAEEGTSGERESSCEVINGDSFAKTLLILHISAADCYCICERSVQSLWFIEALRAQMKERLSQEKLELPPLCCCASSFWDSHPDTCANNCIFHNNPKAYAKAYRSFILFLTFLFYTAYHLSRKPISIVKSQLHRNCSTVIQPPGLNITNNATWCDWAPFDQDNYQTLFGVLDNSFLVAYAIGMFISGIFGERLPLRYYLSFGMLMSGLFTCLFGLGFYWNIHTLGYYAFIQVMNGLMQTTGWPAVVACVGNWFGKGKRGFIMGVWNSHTSVGNILGSLIAGAFVSTTWGMSFIVPGLIIASTGILCFFFLVEKACQPRQPHNIQRLEVLRADLIHPRRLATEELANYLSDFGSGDGRVHLRVPSLRFLTGRQVGGIEEILKYFFRPSDNVPSREPEDVNCSPPQHHSDQESAETEPLLQNLPHVDRNVNGDIATEAPEVVEEHAEAISFCGALSIPGVVEFSLCLLFAKLVSYTFLYWLPLYISNIAHFDAKEAGDMSTLFDVGGIVGGIMAGLVSDYTGGRATTCCVMLLVAAPMLFLYNYIGQRSIGTTIGMLLVCGGLVNGPYALITTAVSADLGTHESLRGNSRALSTVTAIIDGTGSVGAAVGPLLAGVISPTGWNNVFYMLISADVLACLFLSRLVYKEAQGWCGRTPLPHEPEGEHLK
ncbi:hypothetical protein L3Q82_022493, partial [Scortum barcoo]